ncbi:hypothetical protein AMATHDRAFT_7128 [Amanita thiersii Skay4041]|uniref:Complex I-B15 n=1 Tax=Amanita thiersii Skay4041 TaxID=703135 RepID=A0A2A9NFM3_9AGAR|nr:hypothetical protein AMATHDRAFT_7128 [Amanita thiersii Skay4041]
MGAHGAVKQDPAIERFNRMREEAYKNFRWTRGTVRTALLGFVLFPGTLYYLSRMNHTRWDWVARRKNESLEASRKLGDIL